MLRMKLEFNLVAHANFGHTMPNLHLSYSSFLFIDSLPTDSERHS